MPGVELERPSALCEGDAPLRRSDAPGLRVEDAPWLRVEAADGPDVPLSIPDLGGLACDSLTKDHGEARLDGFLRWTENPLAKAAETILVILLAAHLAGGLRVLALEFLGWRTRQKDMVAVSAGVALLVGLVFLLNVV